MKNLDFLNSNIIAHRGYHVKYKENTLESFKEAVLKKYIIELDVHLIKDKTVIIVAQRISTILNADQIIVLEEGKIVGIGRHEELLKTNETYRQIAYSQLSEKELENKNEKEE